MISGLNSLKAKFSLIGHGKMGKMVEKLALAQGHVITDIPDSDVIIDFSHPDAVIKNLETALNHKKNIVIGTTGWLKQLPDVEKIVKQNNLGVLYAPNFSIGVYLFLKTLKEACKLIAPTHAYDAAGYEIHHNQKLDAPSGTAIALENIISKHWPHKPFASVRVGHVPGTHTIVFDSPNDTITLTHEAKGREAFASGAIQAAIWLKGKKGLYTLEEMLG